MAIGYALLGYSSLSPLQNRFFFGITTSRIGFPLLNIVIEKETSTHFLLRKPVTVLGILMYTNFMFTYCKGFSFVLTSSCANWRVAIDFKSSIDYINVHRVTWNHKPGVGSIPKWLTSTMLMLKNRFVLVDPTLNKCFWGLKLKLWLYLLKSVFTDADCKQLVRNDSEHFTCTMQTYWG